MDEVSNRTLATLLIVAIVISVAGMFFAMKGVSQVSNYITGYQTSPAGTTKVNITEVTAITLINDTVDFGTGYRNATAVDVNTECNLTTNQSTKPTCWVNITSWAPRPFLLENSGNNYVNITINSSNKTSFLSGAPTGTDARRYQFVPVDAAPATVFAGRGKNGCNVTFSITAWTEFNQSPQLLCTNMSPYDQEDSFYVDINVSVPSGITGSKSTVVTFYAVKSAQ